MTKRHLLPGALACLAATATVAIAQEGRDDAGTKTEAQEGHGKVKFVCKANDVIGAEVKDQQGESIGSIDDLILVPTSGEIAYVTISSGGVLGLGEETFVAPWKKLRPDREDAGMKARPGTDSAGSGADEDETCFVIDVPADKLSSAPTLPEDGTLDTAWEKRIQAHFGLDKEGGEGRTLEQRTGRSLALGSELKDAEVESMGGENVGHVEDLILDPKEGRIAYVVLEIDEIENLADKQYAVPIEVLQISRDPQEDGALRISATGLDEARLSRAPAFDSAAWERMSNPIWVREVYTFWNLDPYWSRTVEAGYQKPAKTDEKMNKKE
jgi:sporulation protein YlmC with PRC-barrel domain